MSIDFPKEEEAVLKRWKEIKAFERQVQLSKSKKKYTFYDGPPFATGLPVGDFHSLSTPSCFDICAALWALAVVNHQRHHPTILVNERALRGEEIRLGHPWAAH